MGKTSPLLVRSKRSADMRAGVWILDFVVESNGRKARELRQQDIGALSNTASMRDIRMSEHNASSGCVALEGSTMNGKLRGICWSASDADARPLMRENWGLIPPDLAFVGARTGGDITGGSRGAWARADGDKPQLARRRPSGLGGSGPCRIGPVRDVGAMVATSHRARLRSRLAADGRGAGLDPASLRRGWA